MNIFFNDLQSTSAYCEMPHATQHNMNHAREIHKRQETDLTKVSKIYSSRPVGVVFSLEDNVND